jgi:hypothetical protein
MLSLINKGILSGINPIYFCLILLIRSFVAAMYKLFMLSYFLERKVNYKKIYINIFTNGVPTVVLFLTMQTQVESIHHLFRVEGFSEHFQFIYIYYMIVNRIVRAGLRIRKVLNKSKRKALQKQESKAKKLKEE